jgi:protein SCO1/2
MFGTRKIRDLFFVSLVALGAAACLWGQAPPKLQPGEAVPNRKPSILDQAGLDQRLNNQVPLDLTLILALVYFQCPMLCSQVQAGLAGALNGIVRFNVGRDFNVVTVSFDPRDTPQSAAENKKTYLSRYRRAGADQGWHFLTGRKDQIDALAQAVGFRYAWDPEIKQFAHASGIMLLTPDGRVAQYYYGIEYPPRDIQFGLIEASRGKIGNVVDQMLLYCYHYDPTQGKYGAAIFNILRISAGATILLLGGFMVIMLRRDMLAARHSRLN